MATKQKQEQGLNFLDLRRDNATLRLTNANGKVVAEIDFRKFCKWDENTRGVLLNSYLETTIRVLDEEGKETIKQRVLITGKTEKNMWVGIRQEEEQKAEPQVMDI